eukprot:4430721-Amphidinium_carterae.1
MQVLGRRVCRGGLEVRAFIGYEVKEMEIQWTQIRIELQGEHHNGTLSHNDHALEYQIIS